MKGLTLILISLIFLACKSNETKILDYKLEFISEYGNTDNKKLRAITYYQDNGFPKIKVEYGNDFRETPLDTSEYIVKYVFKYDKRGDLIDRKYFKNGENLPWSHFIYEYKYDSINQLIEKVTYETLSFDNHQSFSKSTKLEVFLYHNNGELQSEITLMNFGSPDTSRWVSNYFYDENWHLIKEEFISEDTINYFYNFDSILNQSTFKSNGVFRMTKFDDSKHVIETTFFSPESGDTIREKFTYVEKKLVEELSYYPQIPNNQTIKKFSYNKFDSLKSIEFYYGSGFQFEKREFEYYFK